jgi:peroxiredoxin family protein
MRERLDVLHQRRCAGETSLGEPRRGRGGRRDAALYPVHERARLTANLFFTFFGLDAITRKRHEHIKVATVGNPGLHVATPVGSLPGMPGLMTSYLERKMAKLDIPPIPEFIEMISDTGAGLYGCQASCDLFGISKDDLIEQVQGIITVGDFYAMAAGGQISFT